MGWLAPACNDHAGAAGAAILHFDSGCQMHRECHRAKNTLRMVHQPDEVAQTGLADEIDDTGERRVPMSSFPALDKRYAAPEMIDNLLVMRRVPPFGSEVEFSTCNDDPELVRNTLFRARDRSLLLFRRQMHIAVESRQGNSDVELLLG